jgi:hypothetical protein
MLHTPPPVKHDHWMFHRSGIAMPLATKLSMNRGATDLLARAHRAYHDASGGIAAAKVERSSLSALEMSSIKPKIQLEF